MRRNIPQMKGFWRRIKKAAKKSVSDHRRAVGGPRPPSPTEVVQTVMEMCPTDFIEEKNEFDSDSIFERDNIRNFGPGSSALEQHQEYAGSPGTVSPPCENLVLSTPELGSPSVLELHENSPQHVPDTAENINIIKSNESAMNTKFRASSEPLDSNRFQVATSSLPALVTSKRPSSASPHGYLLNEPCNMSHESPIQNKQAIDLQGSSLAPIDQVHAIFNRCTNSSPIRSSSNLITPEMVRPFPKAPPRKMARRGRQPGKTKILTMTPEKENNNSECLTETLNDSEQPKATQSNMKDDGIQKRKVKKRVLEDTDSGSENENDANKTNKKVPRGRKIIKAKQNPKIKHNKNKKVPEKTKEKKTLKTKQGSKQPAQRNITGKAKRTKNMNDDSETECEDENVLYADSSSDGDFAKNPDVNEQNPKIKHNKNKKVPEKTKEKKTLKTKQGSKQPAQRNITGKAKRTKNMNDDSETECEDENVLYADSSSDASKALSHASPSLRCPWWLGQGSGPQSHAQLRKFHHNSLTNWDVRYAKQLDPAKQ
ncbi:Uncharacterized protein OBRU01_24531, partial [Operophtera brumata]